MDALAQERERKDDLLYNWKMNSQISEVITSYKLVHQHWLIKDPNLRANMTNGIGPMNLVKNRLNFALWPGKRRIKQPDEYDNFRGQLIEGSEQEEDGILCFATAN